MKNLYKKLLEVQREIKAIEKDSVNPHFKNRYFDINTLIAEIKPILSRHGVILMQPLHTSPDGKRSISTNLIEAESGEMMHWSITLPEVEDPQKFGAAITYFRRYALTSLLLLEAEDDDGNSTSKPVPAAPATPKPIARAAKCAKCGAPMAVSKTTGKEYCSAKCWLEPKPEARPMTNADILPKEAPTDGIRLEDVPF